MGAYKGRGMSNRRKLVIALGAGALIAPLACFAQQQRSKVARIGLLEPGSISANRREALIGGLRELGLVEGKNMIIEERRAEGKYERLPGLAAERGGGDFAAGPVVRSASATDRGARRVAAPAHYVVDQGRRGVGRIDELLTDQRGALLSGSHLP